LGQELGVGECGAAATTHCGTRGALFAAESIQIQLAPQKLQKIISSFQAEG